MGARPAAEAAWREEMKSLPQNLAQETICHVITTCYWAATKGVEVFLLFKSAVITEMIHRGVLNETLNQCFKRWHRSYIFMQVLFEKVGIDPGLIKSSLAREVKTADKHVSRDHNLVRTVVWRPRILSHPARAQAIVWGAPNPLGRERHHTRRRDAKLEVAHPVSRRFEKAVDYHSYRLADTSTKYDRFVSKYIAKVAKRMTARMKGHTSKPIDPISVTNFSNNVNCRVVPMGYTKVQSWGCFTFLWTRPHLLYSLHDLVLSIQIRNRADQRVLDKVISPSIRR